MILAPAAVVAQGCRNPYQDATVVQYVQPAYPESAKELGLGIVNARVVVTVSPLGSLIGAKIFQSAGNMAMDQAALSAARQSTYSPKVVNCEPVTGDYLLSVTFDPKGTASLAHFVLPSTASPMPTPQPCAIDALTASQAFDVLQQRRDYQRALEAAAKAASFQMDCFQKLKTSPQRFSLEMVAGSSLSRAADLAYSLGRYQQARDFANKSNVLYEDMVAPSADRSYARFIAPNADANIQANKDLLKRISQLERCAGGNSGSMSSLILAQMPTGSTVHSIGVVGNYAVAISFGPGGYAVRSFLLINRKVWKILASEGGAFDRASYRRNGVPTGIAEKLSAAAACADTAPNS